MSGEPSDPASSLGEGEEPLRRLLAGLELRDGFTLFLVISDSFPALLEVQRRLVEHQRTCGEHLRLITPTTAAEQGLMVARLVALSDNDELAPASHSGAHPSLVVALWPQVAEERHEETWRTVCRVLNERREWFRHHWPHALVIFGSEAAQDILRDEAVDLWSIRSGSYRFPHPSTEAQWSGPEPLPSAPVASGYSTPDLQAIEEAQRLITSGRPADVELGLWVLLDQARKASASGDLRTARVLATKALEATGGLDLLEARALLIIGGVYLREGLLTEGEGSTRRALVIAESRSDQSALFLCYNNLYIIEESRGRFDEAERWLSKAIAIAEERGDNQNLARCYNNMSQIEQARGRLEEAERWLKKAIDINEELSDRPGLANCYNNLSQIEHNRGGLDEAEYWLKKAIDINEEFGDRPNLAVNYNNMSRIEQTRGRLDEAETWLEKATDIAEKLGDIPKLAGCYNNEAEKWLRMAIDIDEELGDRHKLAIRYTSMSKIEQARGRL